MRTNQIKWASTDLVGARQVGNGLSILEFQDDKGEWHCFDLLKTAERVVFGGTCNVGFIESGYIERDDEELDETLSELLADLECYYNQGPDAVSRIACNERM